MMAMMNKQKFNSYYHSVMRSKIPLLLLILASAIGMSFYVSNHTKLVSNIEVLTTHVFNLDKAEKELIVKKNKLIQEQIQLTKAIKETEKEIYKQLRNQTKILNRDKVIREKFKNSLKNSKHKNKIIREHLRSAEVLRNELQSQENQIHKEEKDRKWAYVTLIQGDEFSTAAIGLALSLRKTKTKYPLICLAVNVSLPVKNLLITAGCDIFRETEYRGPPVPKEKSLSGYRFAFSSFTKLTIMSMVEYDKIVYLDADTLVMKNIERMFLFSGPISAVPTSNKLHKDFNAGVAVITPSMEYFDQMMAIYNQGESAGLINLNSDQYFWNRFWKGQWKEMHPYFNTMSKNVMYLSRPQLIELQSAVYVIHFTGKKKPWHKGYEKMNKNRIHFGLIWRNMVLSFMNRSSPKHKSLLRDLFITDKRKEPRTNLAAKH